MCVCQVYPTGPANWFSTGQGYKAERLANKVARHLPAELNKDSCQQMHEHYKHDALTCIHCGLHFTRKNNLWYHIRTKHLGRRFVCPQCQRTFVTNSGLNSHVKHIHEKVSRYKCEVCGKRYTDRSNYFDHIATHSGVKRNVCPICQRQFTFKHSVKAHVVRVHLNTVWRHTLYVFI